MAKAILKYDISDPDENVDFKRAVKSFDMAMALWDIVQLRNKIEKQVKFFFIKLILIILIST